MNTRLKQIIDYKTGGKQTAFAALMGWTPQYLSKLLHGENFGIQPVISLLTVLPEVDARWLLIGDGNMLMSHSSLRKEMEKLWLNKIEENAGFINGKRYNLNCEWDFQRYYEEMQYAIAES